MTTPDPKALRALAEAATPGPWQIVTWAPGFEDRGVSTLDADGFRVVDLAEPDLEADARYIAAVSPPVVLALLDRLEAAERELSAPCLACRIREENGG